MYFTVIKFEKSFQLFLFFAYKIVEEQKERIRRAEIENIVKKRGW